MAPPCPLRVEPGRLLRVLGVLAVILQLPLLRAGGPGHGQPDLGSVCLLSG